LSTDVFFPKNKDRYNLGLPSRAVCSQEPFARRPTFITESHVFLVALVDGSSVLSSSIESDDT